MKEVQFILLVSLFQPASDTTQSTSLNGIRTSNQWDITSSQIEAISSGYRSFSLWTSTIVSNGFGCRGLNPEANFDVLQNPIEPHFWKSHGISGWCNFAAAAARGTAERDRTAKGSLMENRFFLTIEAMLLQIVEFVYTLCIVESENEEKKRTCKKKMKTDLAK